MSVIIASRTILHVDMDSFYPSVETCYDLSLRGKAVAVCGRVEERHGIILSANYAAKQYGVKTGDPGWMATSKCKNIILVEPHYDRYVRASKAVNKILSEYSPLREGMGLDEQWADITGTLNLFGGNALDVAKTIQQRIQFELGFTCSIGISFNKTMSKLGSDYNKPAGITVITPDNLKEIVWPLPVKDLLYVGRATEEKLHRRRIDTIGSLVSTDPKLLQQWLGKWGLLIYQFANGYENYPVAPENARPAIKSISNGTTTPRDMESETDLKITTYILAESVAARLRMEHLKCTGVQVGMRFPDLSGCERQARLEFASCTSESIAKSALALIQRHRYSQPLRSLTVRAINLLADDVEQLSLMPEKQKDKQQEELEHACDTVRRRFGNFALRRGVTLVDQRLGNLNPADHVAHPEPFFR